MLIYSLFSLLFLLLFSGADAYFGYGLFRCQFTSPDDAVYLWQLYFNKMLVAQYNSTLGKYTGYTKKAIEITDGLNKNPAFLRQEKKNEERCKTNVPLILDDFLKPAAQISQPSVRLRSVEAAGSRHPGMLICSVYNFYPKQIRLTWLRNGKETTSDVTSTDEQPNGNWLYQIHSYLEYTPKPGEKITCMVEHVSLREPKLHDWEPTSQSGMTKITVGAAGLLLGLVFFVPGLIYYKKNTTGRELVPTS